MLINLCHTTLPIIFGGAGNLIGAGAVFYVVASLMGGVSVFTSRCQKQSVSRTSRRVVEELEQERSQKKYFFFQNIRSIAYFPLILLGK